MRASQRAVRRSIAERKRHLRRKLQPGQRDDRLHSLCIQACRSRLQCKWLQRSHQQKTTQSAFNPEPGWALTHIPPLTSCNTHTVVLTLTVCTSTCWLAFCRRRSDLINPAIIIIILWNTLNYWWLILCKIKLHLNRTAYWCGSFKIATPMLSSCILYNMFSSKLIFWVSMQNILWCSEIIESKISPFLWQLREDGGRISKDMHS